MRGCAGRVAWSPDSDSPDQCAQRSNARGLRGSGRSGVGRGLGEGRPPGCLASAATQALQQCPHPRPAHTRAHPARSSAAPPGFGGRRSGAMAGPHPAPTLLRCGICVRGRPPGAVGSPAIVREARRVVSELLPRPGCPPHLLEELRPVLAGGGQVGRGAPGDAGLELGVQRGAFGPEGVGLSWDQVGGSLRGWVSRRGDLWGRWAGVLTPMPICGALRMWWGLTTLGMCPCNCVTTTYDMGVVPPGW